MSAEPINISGYKGRGMEPQQENFTQTPNAFFDALLEKITSICELKVTLALIRKTNGYHKQSDVVSISQLGTMTGLYQQGVVDGLNLGLKRGTIQRHKAGQSWEYSLNLQLQVVPLEDYLSPDKEVASPPTRLEAVPSEDGQVVPLEDTQKKVLNKTLNKIITTPNGVEQPPLFEPERIVVKAKPAKAEKPKAERKPVHPAVDAFIQKFALDESIPKRDRVFPNSVQIADIIAAVGENPTPETLDEWAKCMRSWQAHGWRAHNVPGLIDHYQKKGYLENGTKPNGQSAGQQYQRGRSNFSANGTVTPANQQRTDTVQTPVDPELARLARADKAAKDAALRARALSRTS